MTEPAPILGSAAFARALTERPLVALDIGARRGFVADLLPIASAVDAIGFEPDAGECERLNREARSTPGPWRSLHFLAAALAGKAGSRDLHLTRHGGTSSMLAAIPGMGAGYMRDDYFAVERTVSVDTQTLDDALARFEIGTPAYLKVDVEGMEKAIFEGGPRTLDRVLAVRTEVAFMRTRHGQPLYHEIDALLRRHGLLPFRLRGTPRMAADHQAQAPAGRRALAPLLARAACPRRRNLPARCRDHGRDRRGGR